MLICQSTLALLEFVNAENIIFIHFQCAVLILFLFIFSPKKTASLYYASTIPPHSPYLLIFAHKASRAVAMVERKEAKKEKKKRQVYLKLMFSV